MSLQGVMVAPLVQASSATPVPHDFPPAAPSPSPPRPVYVWVAILLALISGVVLFLQDLSITLRAKALVDKIAAIPNAPASAVPPGLVTLIILIPLIIGLVLLLLYARLGWRIWKRDPKSRRSAVVVCIIFIALSILGVSGNLSQLTFAGVSGGILALNVLVIVLLYMPGSKSYFTAGVPASVPAGAPPSYPPPTTPTAGSASRYCPSCGEENPPGSAYCSMCSKPLPILATSWRE